MKKTVTIKLLVGSNGKWSAYGSGDSKQTFDADIGLLADDIMDWPEDHRADPVDPAAKVLYNITAEIEVPDGDTQTVIGEATKVE